MKKALFFSLPSTSVNNTLLPVIQSLSQEYEVIVYNTTSFIQASAFHLNYRGYPDSYKGYGTDRIQSGISYFQFAEVLIDTTKSIIDFLIKEVKNEKPDFIIHSHLALWGKIVATHFRLPAVSLFTTFVLDMRIMQPYLNGAKKSKIDLRQVDHALNYYRKIQGIYDELGILDRPDIWDAYINQEHLNLCFILEEFQPKKHLLGDNFYFLGSPQQKLISSKNKQLLYISLGTFFNSDPEFYKICCDVIRDLPFQCVISGGKIMSRNEPVASNIEMVDFADQLSILQNTMIFITRGGMASVHESLYNLTPMIVIPEIPEQIVTAQTIDNMQLGVYLPRNEFTHSTLKNALCRVSENILVYVENISKLLHRVESPVGARACSLIKDKMITS